MTLTKAIQVLEIETRSRQLPPDPDLYNAHCLLIEAAKWVIKSRITTPGTVPTLLPGETL